VTLTFRGRSLLQRGGALAAACLVVCASLPPVAAQTPTPPPPATPPVSATPPDAVPLSLADALRDALENNLDLRVQRVSPEVAAQRIEIAWAPFDPSINADARHTESKSEPSSIFQAETVTQDDASVTWADRLTFGPSYTVGLAATKTDAPNAFRSYNPSYDSGITGSLRFPLLRGLGREVTTVDVLLAREDLEISRQDLAARANETLQGVENAYWALVGAGEALAVSLQSRSLAQELLELNRRKVEVGTLAPIEITQAEAGVAEREEAVILAEASRRDAEDQLRAFMAIPREDPRWSRPIEPTLKPEFVEVPVNVEQRLDQALATRPELDAARRARRNAELTERASRNQLKPQLDLVASVNPTGNNLVDIVDPDGVPNSGDEFPETGGLGESLSEIPEFRNYSWSVGAEFSIPLRNRAAKASNAIATLERQRAELSIASLEQAVRVEVRTAARGVTSGAERIAAARKNVELQERKLDAERKKFENGMSTSFEVLTFQTDLANAQLRLIQALIDYQRARVELERVTGTLLEARGMRFDSTNGR
jgi:outer membrane protein